MQHVERFPEERVHRRELLAFPPRVDGLRPSSSRALTVPLPPRRPLLLSLLLLAIGAALLIAQQVGTFNSRQCASDDPALCWETPDPWPGFIGTAFAVGGLGLLTAGFAGELRARRRKSAPPATATSAGGPSVATAKPEDGTSVTSEVVPDVQDR